MEKMFSKTKKIFPGLFLTSILFVCCSCKDELPETPSTYYKEASENKFDATINSIVGNDDFDREFGEKDVMSSDRKVGMFYFVWHGQHTERICDVEKAKAEDPDELWNPYSEKYKLNDFFYFSEPLYGYYCSEDPWVLSKHIEMLTMSGIDYISFDLTNFSIYEENCRVVMDELLKYQALGWKVPYVTSILNGTAKEARHAERITNFYDIFYTDPKYDSLWFRDRDSGKPIITISIDLYLNDLPEYIRDNISFRNTIWPYDKSPTVHNDQSWMDWTYPQRVYVNEDGNSMSVSVSQHCEGAFGNSVNPATRDEKYNGNRGRGYDYDTKTNKAENVNKGTNLETQWSNAHKNRHQLDEVFVTGWNEWIAYKLRTCDLDSNRPTEENVTFCDTCDIEFSRDIEMTKGGYKDNFYLQNMRNTRLFKNTQDVHYFGKYSSPSLQNDSWEGTRTYLDFTQEVFNRNFDNTNHSAKYTTDSARNDIKSIDVTHDANNLYMKVALENEMIIDSGKDNNLNILLSVKGNEGPSLNGYQYIINRKALEKGSGRTSVEKIKEDGKLEFEPATEALSYCGNKFFSVAIPLATLGISEEQVDDFTIDFKVADNVSDYTDYMNFYIDGDVAPIGRLNYRYNSKNK